MGYPFTIVGSGWVLFGIVLLILADPSSPLAFDAWNEGPQRSSSFSRPSSVAPSTEGARGWRGLVLARRVDSSAQSAHRSTGASSEQFCRPQEIRELQQVCACMQRERLLKHLSAHFGSSGKASIPALRGASPLRGSSPLRGGAPDLYEQDFDDEAIPTNLMSASVRVTPQPKYTSKLQPRIQQDTYRKLVHGPLQATVRMAATLGDSPAAASGAQPFGNVHTGINQTDSNAAHASLNFAAGSNGGNAPQPLTFHGPQTECQPTSVGAADQAAAPQHFFASYVLGLHAQLQQLEAMYNGVPFWLACGAFAMLCGVMVQSLATLLFSVGAGYCLNACEKALGGQGKVLFKIVSTYLSLLASMLSSGIGGWVVAARAPTYPLSFSTVVGSIYTLAHVVRTVNFEKRPTLFGFLNSLSYVPWFLLAARQYRDYHISIAPQLSLPTSVSSKRQKFRRSPSFRYEMLADEWTSAQLATISVSVALVIVSIKALLSAHSGAGKTTYV